MPHLTLTQAPLEPHVQDDIDELARSASAHDGVEALSEQVLLAVHRPGDRPVAHVLVRESGAGQGPRGELVAYGQVDRSGEGPHAAELVVLPRARRTGLGTVVLVALQGAAADSADGDHDADDADDADGADGAVASPPHGDVAVWAHGDGEPARAFADARGLRRVRELHIMGHPLGRADGGDSGASDGSESPEAPEPPSGLRLDPFRPGRDEEAWVELNAAAFAEHPEQGRMTVSDLRARMDEPWFDPERLWFVRESSGGEPLASLWLKQQPGEDVAELYILGVRPSAQGRGLGRYLTSVALADAEARGAARMILYVDGDNAGAVHTYERAGFAVERTEAQYVG